MTYSHPGPYERVSPPIPPVVIKVCTYFGVARPLGAGQVDHEQPALAHGRRRPGRLAHRHAEQRVAPGRRPVRARRLDRPLPVALVQQPHHLVNGRHHRLRETGHLDVPVPGRVLPQLQEPGRRVQEVPDVLVVYLQVRHFHLSALPVALLFEFSIVIFIKCIEVLPAKPDFRINPP